MAFDKQLVDLVCECAATPCTVEELNQRFRDPPPANGIVPSATFVQRMALALDELAKAGWLTVDYTTPLPTYSASTKQRDGARKDPTLLNSVNDTFHPKAGGVTIQRSGSK